MTRRLLLGYLSITVLVLVLLELPLAVFYAQRERERVTSDLSQDASVVATLYEDTLESGAAADPGPARAYAARTGARVVVVDRDGISVIDTGGDVDRDLSTRPEIALALTGRRASGTRLSETLDTNLVYVALPVASGGVVHGALRLTLDTDDVTARIHRFWLALGAVAVVVIGSAALAGWAMARSVSGPIRRLNSAAARFARGDLTTTVAPVTGPVEVRTLGATMQTMAGQLDELLGRQRRFVADASHQLRTPLTALRLRLENLQDGVPDVAAPELDAAIEEITRLSTLVSDLLHLARADAHPTPAEVDLTRLTMERVDTWTAAAEAVGATVVADLPARPALVEAVPGAIEQILDNLLDNALNASPPGATVTARVTSSAAAHVLTIADEGPGLSDDEKVQAVQRFWRGSTSTPGSGLGLAIVAALATASGATLALTDAAAGGLAVSVSFRATGPRTGMGGP